MIDTNMLPLTLGQFEKTTVDIRFAPISLGLSTGELMVPSNDPRGIITSSQFGNGVYAADTMRPAAAGKVAQSLYVALLVGGGAGVFFLTAWLLKSPELKVLFGSFSSPTQKLKK